MSKHVNTRNPLHAEINAYSCAVILSSENLIHDADLRKYAAKLMTSISDECMKRGARDVGHIKAYIEYDTGFLFADTLGDPSDVTIEGRSGSPSYSFRIVINSVIYGLDEDGIKNATEGALQKVSESSGIISVHETKKTTPIQVSDRRTK
ncbi:MAG: hypothetical protein C4538_13325 [Nitrospiraceae bacterium]|nr:MAG: hypothetical protein C4538_13325 [Nitrospiraceae bacterium]